MRTLLTLMRVDWRTFRPLVIGSLVLCGGPLILCASFVAFLEPEHDYADSPANRWLSVIGPASTWSMVCAALVAAAFGSTAWAAERAERSATFVDLLPPTRAQRAASKVLVTAGWLLTVFAVDVAVYVHAAHQADSLIDHARMTPVEVLEVAGQIGCFGVLAFGVAFASSTVLGSSAISAITGCVTSLVAAMVVAVVSHHESGRPTLWAAVSLSLGTESFLVGTAHYLRRSEP